MYHRQIPGVGFIIETGTRQAQLYGFAFVVETVTTVTASSPLLRMLMGMGI